MKKYSLFVIILLLCSSSYAQQATNSYVLRPDQVFDGYAVHKDWIVMTQGDKIVFASNPNNTEGSKVLAWNGLPYLDLYEANMDADGNLSNVSILKGDINTKYNESSTAFTKDGKTGYFTRNNFFEGKKGPISASVIQRVCKKAGEQAQLNFRLTPRLLRHAFATHLYEAKENLITIQALLGHAHIATTQIYTHVSTEHLRGTKSPLDRIFG